VQLLYRIKVSQKSSKDVEKVKEFNKLAFLEGNSMGEIRRIIGLHASKQFLMGYGEKSLKKTVKVLDEFVREV